MKRFISFLLTVVIMAQAFCMLPMADTIATLGADDISVEIKGNYSIDEIKESIKQYKNGDITTDDLHTKYNGQIIAAEVYCSDIDALNKLYGLQFNVSTDNDSLAIAYVITNIQNSNKIGTALWSAYLNTLDAEYKEAKVLLYGTKEINSELNKTVNLIDNDKYSVATIYLIADKDFKESASLMFTVEDVASKNANGEVVSAAASFKNMSFCTVKNEKQGAIKLEMLGAQVRTSIPQGLRFGTKVSFGTEQKKIADISYGTLIAVTNQLGSKELTLECDVAYYNSEGTVISEEGNSVVFTGEIVNFPKNGSYDTVNFTARAYIRYKRKGESKYSVLYADPIIRNVDNIKSQLGIK